MGRTGNLSLTTCIISFPWWFYNVVKSIRLTFHSSVGVETRFDNCVWLCLVGEWRRAICRTLCKNCYPILLLYLSQMFLFLSDFSNEIICFISIVIMTSLYLNSKQWPLECLECFGMCLMNTKSRANIAFIII